mgnify:CR=1 FL=1
MDDSIYADGMDTLQLFAEWAWARHHNPWSWYIRPLFLVPYCYFAWRRNLFGVLITILALASSMFWFPAPMNPDPKAVEFLKAERQYLLSPWNFTKVFFAVLVPLFFVLLGLAFWRRNILAGLAAVNLATIIKIGWSFYFAGHSGWTVVAPALVGVVVINCVVLASAKLRG